MVIPFEKLAVGPSDEEDVAAFNPLAERCNNLSSAIGWAIGLGNRLRGERENIQGDIFKRTMARLPGVDPRLVTGYSVCLLFAEKVGVTVKCKQCW